MPNAVVEVTRRELGAVPDAVASIAEGLQHESYRVTVGGRGYVLQFAASEDCQQADSFARGLYWYVALQDSALQGKSRRW